MDQTLINLALECAENAYAPHSNFKVGTAVLLEDGTIVTGNNQENSSYPLGMCAERVALHYAKSQHPDLAVRTIAIASPSTSKIVTPCGACRQVMSEVSARQNSDFTVIMAGANDSLTCTISELLPYAFEF